jgi:hypothetical protein
MDRRTVTMGLAIAGLSACAFEAAAESGAENPLLVAFAKTLSAHDMDAFAALFADDYVNHQVSAATGRTEAITSASRRPENICALRRAVFFRTREARRRLQSDRAVD